MDRNPVVDETAVPAVPTDAPPPTPIPGATAVVQYGPAGFVVKIIRDGPTSGGNALLSAALGRARSELRSAGDQEGLWVLGRLEAILGRKQR